MKGQNKNDTPQQIIGKMACSSTCELLIWTFERMAFGDLLYPLHLELFQSFIQWMQCSDFGLQ